MAAAGDICRFIPNGELIVNESTGLCLAADDENNLSLDTCNYTVSQAQDAEPSSNIGSHQRWGLNPGGYIVNLDLDKCLNIDGDPGTQPGTVANVRGFELERTTSKSFNSDKLVTDQQWTISYIECANAADAVDCVADPRFLPELDSSRRVLHADQAITNGNAGLQQDISDFTDSGYLALLNAGDSVLWEDRQLHTGRYLTTIRQSGEITGQVKALGINLNGVPQADLPLPATNGAWLESSIEIDVDLLGTELTLEALNDDRYHIDRVIITPLF